MGLNPCGDPQLKIGRDEKGRFRPGNAGGPGNPFARKVAALRKALLDAVSEQDLSDMIAVLKLKALSGDTVAVKILLEYCVGKPERVKDPDRMDVDEWDRLRQMRVSDAEFHRTMDDVPACLACHRAEFFWPCNIQDDERWASTVYYARTRHLPIDQGGIDPNLFASVECTEPPPLPDDAPERDEAVSQYETPQAPAEPAAKPRPAPAKREGTSDPKRLPAGPSPRSTHPPTQRPLPNGGIGESDRSKPEPPPAPHTPGAKPPRPRPRR